VEYVHGDEALPKVTDVVVVGGGIAGSATALELAERGLKVALCEKGGIGEEQSSRNWGWVRLSRRDPREIPLMVESLKIWETLHQRTGRDVGYRRAGIVFAAPTERLVATYDRWRQHLRDYTIESRLLSASEFRAQYPDMQVKVKGALFTPVDGKAEPQRVAPALAEAARARGATVLTGCAVRGFERTGGKVSGVVTERGPIACSAVVVAGGIWSHLFCGQYGLDLPQLNVMNSVLRTTPVAGGPEQSFWTDGFAFSKRLDGGYTISDSRKNKVDIVPRSFRYLVPFLPRIREEWRILKLRVSLRTFQDWATPKRWSLDGESPFEYDRVRDPKPARKLTEGALARLRQAVPALRDVKIAQQWAGDIDVLPDAIPIISAVDAIPGLYIATGFSGHGFGIGPAAGRLMADIVTGAKPLVDPGAFRFSRFGDGSKNLPQRGF
jgi:glycine/D-amino acid oxidase-like deaminating enzyme